MKFLKFLSPVLFCASLVVPAPAAAGDAMPPGMPEHAGFSTQRLARAADFIAALTARGSYAGAVSLVARDGRIVDWRAHGHQDIARTTPMAPDSIFRIYSMTKPVTSVAVLLLMEEGKLALDEAVATFLPEFANLKIYAGGSAGAPVLRAPRQALTIRMLLTHTAGFATHGAADNVPRRLLERARLDASPDLAHYSRRVAQLPLADEPGQAFHYDGVQTHVLARLVEVVSGQPFAAFLQARIFDPLGMVDTGFVVPAASRSRIAQMTTTGADGTLVPALTTKVAGEMPQRYPSGAGGLYSTAVDYLRFCQMLLDGGQLSGVRVLGRKTVELMMSNHLAQFLDPPVTSFSKAEGFGLGGYVVLDAARRGRLGSVGTFGWSGAGSTYFAIDPRERLVTILMLQHLPQGLPADPPKANVRFTNLVYQALVDRGPP